ncbi:MAG: hypothetical protein ACYS8Y_08475, partial [Planctomycetota bacterium]
LILSGLFAAGKSVMKSKVVLPFFSVFHWCQLIFFQVAAAPGTFHTKAGLIAKKIICAKKGRGGGTGWGGNRCATLPRRGLKTADNSGI